MWLSALPASERECSNGGIYVYYFVHLAGTPSQWVDRLEESSGRLRALAAYALTGDGHDRRERDVNLELSDHQEQVGGYLIPVRWAATGLFSGLSGDLSLQPIDSGTTQITLRASYAPAPSDDPAANHRSVETVVKRFLDSLVALAD